MINVPNQIYHVTRAQEDVLDFSEHSSQLQSQRAIYGMNTRDHRHHVPALNQPWFNESTRPKPYLAEMAPPAQTMNDAQAILNRSISDIKSKIQHGIHQVEEIARDVKTRSVNTGERTADYLTHDPNVAIGLELAKSASETFAKFMNDLNSKMECLVNRISRPKWEFKPGYQPYCQRSFDAGNYEYEVMVFRRRLNCMDKLTAKCNMPNVFR